MSKLTLSAAERQRRSEQMRRINADPELAAKRRERHAAGGWPNPVSAELLRRRWQDPDYRAARVAAMTSPDAQKKAKEARRAAIDAKKQAGEKPHAAHRYSATSRAALRDASRSAIVANAKRFHGVDIDVPAWVPNGLVGEYCAAAAMYGEEQAASIIRAMKRAEADEGRAAP